MIFYIKCDLSLLSAKGRPLSQNYGIAKLYEERKAWYERAADFTVENNGEKQSAAETIARKFAAFNYNPKN